MPLACCRSLALRAVPVAAAVVGDGRIATGRVLAAHDVAAEGCRAAVLDRRHDLQLAEADMAGIGRTPCRPVVAEDIRDLQRRTRPRAVRPAAGLSHSRSWRASWRASCWPSCEAATAGRAGSRFGRSCRWRRGCNAPSYPTCGVPEAPG